MKIDGWNIDDALFADPPSVDVTQRLFESPAGRFAAVAYHINEYRMGTEIARLAVLARTARHVWRFVFRPFPRYTVNL